MSKFFLNTLICLAGFFQAAVAQVNPFISVNEPRFLITDVELIDGTGSAVQQNVNVLVENGLIAALGVNMALPDNEEVPVINGSGKTLIPGLVMLHEHIFYTKTFEGGFNVVNMSNTFPRMYLAGGVTTMRTAGSVSPHTDLNIQRRVRSGAQVGPKMDVTGPFIERAGLDIPQLPILPDSVSAGETTAYWAQMGCTSFKVYNYLTQDDLGEVVAEAHKAGYKVTGHLCSISYREAAETGIDNLEHGFTQASDFIPGRKPNECDPFQRARSLDQLSYDSPEMKELMEFLIEKEVAVTTTPAVFAPVKGYEAVLGGGEAALNPEILGKVQERYIRSLNYDSILNARYQKELHFIKQFYDMGGNLVVGTDPTGSGRTLAGYANLWTLESLAEAGFTLEEIVMLCTSRGAKYLERFNTVGSIEPGKAADLVLINGLLSEDIQHIRKVETVFKDGVGYDSERIFKSVEGKVGLY